MCFGGGSLRNCQATKRAEGHPSLRFFSSGHGGRPPSTCGGPFTECPKLLGEPLWELLIPAPTPDHFLGEDRESPKVVNGDSPEGSEPLQQRRHLFATFGVRLVADGAKEPDFLSRASDGLPGLADLLEATLALSRLDPNPGTVAAYDEDPAILEGWSWVAASRSWTSRAEGRRGRRITDAGLDWAHTTATSWLICSSADQRTATSSDEPTHPSSSVRLGSPGTTSPQPLSQHDRSQGPTSCRDS